MTSCEWTSNDGALGLGGITCDGGYGFMGWNIPDPGSFLCRLRQSVFSWPATITSQSRHPLDDQASCNKHERLNVRSFLCFTRWGISLSSHKEIWKAKIIMIDAIWCALAQSFSRTMSSRRLDYLHVYVVMLKINSLEIQQDVTVEKAARLSKSRRDFVVLCHS